MGIEYVPVQLRNALDVDDGLRRKLSRLHLEQQIGPAGDGARVTRVRSKNLNRLMECSRSKVLKGFHRRLSRIAYRASRITLSLITFYVSRFTSDAFAPPISSAFTFNSTACAGPSARTACFRSFALSPRPSRAAAKPSTIMLVTA